MGELILRNMDNIKENLPSTLWVLVGALVTVAIVWQVFWEFIHPILLSVSSIFTYNPAGRVGRYPDSPTQVALFVVVGIGWFIYIMILALAFGDLEFTDILYGFYILMIVLPVAIIKNDILPIFEIDRWEHDPYEDDS